jgi:hypothetical protein
MAASPQAITGACTRERDAWLAGSTEKTGDLTRAHAREKADGAIAWTNSVRRIDDSNATFERMLITRTAASLDQFGNAEPEPKECVVKVELDGPPEFHAGPNALSTMVSATRPQKSF